MRLSENLVYDDSDVARSYEARRLDPLVVCRGPR